MKITHPSGQHYDLPADFRLEMSRTNPFFHKRGEQSLPCSLPPSRKNMELLNQPANIANSKKIESRLDVTIESGSFFLKARQAILNAKRNQPISTSFYLNEGAFYERIKNLTLVDVFNDKHIQFSNVDDAIDFTFSLMSQKDERLSCFEVHSDGRILNQVDWAHASSFRHAINRTETIDEKEVFIPRGMFITPFVKVRHVLSEVASYLGYSLGASFMDNAPFADMVFLNSNTDTILSGSIEYVDIIPDLSVEEFFDVLRKFNCEIVPDDSKKKLRLILFNDLLSYSKEDITNQLTGDLLVTYHNSYKQLRLTSNILNIPESDEYVKEGFGFEANHNNEFTTISDIARMYPMARVSETDDSIIRIGYKGERELIERVGSLHCNYFSGDIMDEEEKSFPDTIFEVTKSVHLTQDGEGGPVTGWNYTLIPYVGQNRSLRTKLVFETEDEVTGETTDVKSSNNQKLTAMLCFYYYSPNLGFNVGTVHNYDLDGQKLWDNTLAYNGVDGIYEKFWRAYDDLLRNALLEVRGDFLLTESQKNMLSSHRAIMLDSQVLIPSEIKYIPGENIPRECSFLTTKLQKPISRAKTIDEYFINSAYKWSLKIQRSFTNTLPPGTFEIIIYKSEPVAYFPNNPTPDQYNAGGQYFQMEYEVEYGYSTLFSYTKRGDGIITTWLEAVLA